MSAPIAAASPHVMNTYNRVPIALDRGQGVRVWDVNGKEYLDALAGIAVSTLGHDHPRLVPALQEQVARLIHCSNYYHVPGQERLATLLTERAHMDKAFFCSTGLEANEAQIKIARKFGVDRGIANPVIVVYEHAFHGRSMATMAATANEKVRSGLAPCPRGFCACRPTTSPRWRRPPRATRTSSPCCSNPSRAKAVCTRCAPSTSSRCASSAMRAAG